MTSSHQPETPSGPDSPAEYEQHRDEAGRRRREKSRSVREIGPIPDIANLRRRARCRSSLRLFCETYNRAPFYFAWSPDHLKAISRLEEAATQGALFAFAMPRGSGKSVLCRMATLWAISYAWCRYVFILGSTAGKASENLSAIKTFARFLPEYGADFPEIVTGIRALGGIPQRAGGQLCQGESTMVEWSESRIVLPTVPPPANWPKGRKLRQDGKAPTSGAVVSAAGLTAEGIRGSVLTLTTGEQIRPDLVLLDDPQTPESARSPKGNDDREQLVAADVMGLAAPGYPLSAVMPCTVIAKGDMIDRFLDRSKHALWRGERTKLLTAMPQDLAAWDHYFEVYRSCAQEEPPDYAPANSYYQAHRTELDAGAVHSWPERKEDWEISAIQSAMHLYERVKHRAFMAEYQNDPQDDELGGQVLLTPDGIMSRVNRHERGRAPAATTRLTAFIDVQGSLLFYAVVAWTDSFGGAVLDYGAWPAQPRLYYTLRDASPTLDTVLPGRSLEAQLYGGLEALAAELLGRDWLREGDTPLRIERLLIDAAWGQSTGVVRQFVRQSAYAALIYPSFGKGIGAGSNPLTDRAKKPGERFGLDWVMPLPRAGFGRYVLYDTNSWKSFLAARLLVDLGDRSALTLWGDRPAAHRLLADHLVSERPVRTKRILSEGGGREVDIWNLQPGRDNHYLDCLTGCCVAASVQGVSLSELPPPKPVVPVKTITYQEAMNARK